MKVVINNKKTDIPEGLTVSNMLKHLGLRMKTSVWVNGVQLLLREYDSYIIKENDVIKVLKIIGGG